jgi:hypothetical protein
VLQDMTNDTAQHTAREVLPEGADGSDPDIIFGMAEIGRAIGRSPKEVGYLLSNTTLLNGAVKRVSHKVTIASRHRLRNLALTTLARD